jgi:hypothetical protein
MGSISVIEGGRGKSPANTEREDALKRLALQIATELPKDTEEAHRVLEHAKTLLVTFLAPMTPV